MDQDEEPGARTPPLSGGTSRKGVLRRLFEGLRGETPSPATPAAAGRLGRYRLLHRAQLDREQLATHAKDEQLDATLPTRDTLPKRRDRSGRPRLLEPRQLGVERLRSRQTGVQRDRERVERSRLLAYDARERRSTQAAAALTETISTRWATTSRAETA